MKNLIFALIIFTSFSYGTLAQDTTRLLSNNLLSLSFGLSGGAPLGSNADVSAFVIGGDLQVEFGLTRNFRLTASGGVESRINKGGVVNTIYYAPLLGGLRFYIDDKFYLSEQAGYSLALTKGLNGLFTNVVGVGYRLSKSSDLLLAYKGLFKSGTTLTNFNTLALRIAYVFGK